MITLLKNPKLKVLAIKMFLLATSGILSIPANSQKGEDFDLNKLKPNPLGSGSGGDSSNNFDGDALGCMLGMWQDGKYYTVMGYRITCRPGRNICIATSCTYSPS